MPDSAFRIRHSVFGFHDQTVFQKQMRQEIVDALLGHLLDVITADLASENDALGIELNIQVPNSPPGPGAKVLLQLVFETPRQDDGHGS
jgi:hypothetical protein